MHGGEVGVGWGCWLSFVLRLVAPVLEGVCASMQATERM
jgi:hypothetical protein